MDFSPYVIIAFIVIAMTFKSIILPLFKLATQQKRASGPKVTPSKTWDAFIAAPKDEAYPYISCGSILTPTELAFFKALVPVINGQWHIFTKVRMEDIINVKSGVEKKAAYGYRSRIKSRHVDFVLCDKETLEILMCIELDDSSHQTAKAKEADQFKNKAFKDADLTLIRIPARRSYSDDYLRGLLFEPEEVSEAPRPTSHREGATNQDQRVSPQLEMVATSAVSEDPHARWKPSTDL